MSRSGFCDICKMSLRDQFLKAMHHTLENQKTPQEFNAALECAFKETFEHTMRLFGSKAGKVEP